MDVIMIHVTFTRKNTQLNVYVSIVLTTLNCSTVALTMRYSNLSAQLLLYHLKKLNNKQIIRR